MSETVVVPEEVSRAINKVVSILQTTAKEHHRWAGLWADHEDVDEANANTAIAAGIEKALDVIAEHLAEYAIT